MIDPTTSYAERMGLSLMSRFEQSSNQWHYVTGLGLECLYRVGRTLGKEAWTEWVKNQYDAFLVGDERIEGYDLEEYSLDQVSPGKVLFDLYHDTGDLKYRRYLDILFSQLLTHPRTASHGFWHKKIYPYQMWLDGIYMQGTFYLRYAVLTGNVQSCLEDLVGQCELIFEKTYDAASGLLFHAWDESHAMAWCKAETGLSSCFWSRALGWYCMALVDILDFIPEREEYETYRTRLIELATKLVIPIIAVQDNETGLWWQVLDQGCRGKNYLESSGSSMFVYFLFKMVRKDWLKGELAQAAVHAARKSFAGLVEHKLRIDDAGQLHLTDICRGAGLGKYYPECPFRDGSFAYYTEQEPIVEDNLQGVGPFLLACLEAEHAQELQGFPDTPYWDKG